MISQKELIITGSVTEELMARRDQIIQMIAAVNKRLKTAPDGSLRVAKKCKTYQFFQRTAKDDTVGKYIPTNNQELAAALAQKDYDTKLLAALGKNLKAIEKFLKDYEQCDPLCAYEDLAAPRKKMVKPEFESDKEFVRKWLSEPYDKLGFKEGDAVYYTDRGERVRSKSEVLIANELYRHGIPYRYEYPVYSNGVLMAAPDFNCLNVRLRKEYYWEHLGMMGKEEYANRNAAKIEKYTLAKDFDETKLILTFETEKHPLNTRVIEEKIKTFLI